MVLRFTSTSLRPAPTIGHPGLLLRLAGAAAIALALSGSLHAAEAKPSSEKASGFFGLDQLHRIHLVFSSNAWAMIQVERPLLRGPGRPGRLGPAGPPVEGRDLEPPEVRPERAPRDGFLGPRPGDAVPFPRPPGPIDANFPSAPATVVVDGRQLERVSIRFKGNSSFNNARGSLKRSFKLDFNDLVKGQRLEGLDKLNLNNNTMDPSQMAEALAYDLCRAAGVPSPRTAFARVDLTVEGVLTRQCLGLYTVVEQVEADFLKSRFGNSKGLLLKPETPQPLSSLGSSWAPYERLYEPKPKATPEQAANLLDLVRLVQSGPDEELFRELPRRMDLDGLLRFLAVNVVVGNLDGPLFNGHNFYLYLDADSSRWHWIPWDMNHAFGTFPVAGPPQRQMRLSLKHPHVEPNRFLERLFAHREWTEAYLRHVEDLLNGAFRPERLNALIDDAAKLLRPVVADESPEALRLFDGSVASLSEYPEYPTGERQGPGRRQFVNPLKPWIAARSASLRDQLAGRSEGESPLSLRPPAR